MPHSTDSRFLLYGRVASSYVLYMAGNGHFTTTITTMTLTNKHLYEELKSRADRLTHYRDDLEVHDRTALETKIQPGQTWLWQVRPSGTWLTRWDEDPNGGEKDSLIECLIRQAQAGNWLNASWYLIHCHKRHGKQVYGFISQEIPVEKLAAALPRPKPTPKLPKESVCGRY